LIDQSDCKNCHAIDRQINGPAYQAIAARYRSNRDFAVPSIYRKIIYGGVGNWGQSIMIPHPNIREEEAIQMALWILSLGDPPKPVSTMPLAGMLALAPETGAFVLRAGYRDQPSNGQPSLETQTTLVLRPNTLQAESCDARSEGVGNYKPEGQEQTVLQELKHNAWFVWHQADLVGVKSLTMRFAYGDKKAPQAGGSLEIRRGTRHGPILATVDFESKNAAEMVFETRTVPLLPQHPGIGLQDVFFVCKNPQNQGQSVIAVDWVRFDW
jgi:cytochrome c